MDMNELKEKILALLNQATDGAKDFAGKATDGVKGFAGGAADKAKAGSRIAKLAMEAASEKENLKKTYQEVGRLYYDTHKDDPDGFFVQLVEEIRLAEKSIADKEAEIAALKASFKAEAGDVTVEFEEVVDKAEAEAEAVKDACECAAEKVEEKVEETVEEIKDHFEG